MKHAPPIAETVAPPPMDIRAALPASPSLKERASAGTVWGIVDSIGQQLLSLAIFVVLARILSPGLFGIVSTALVFVFLMRSTVLNAVSTSLVTLRNPTDEDYDTAFWLLVIISGLAVLILNLAAGPLARLYHIAAFEIVIRATSLMVLLFGLSYAHYGWARRNFRFRALALRNIAGLAVGGIAGIAAALAGYGLAALVLNQVLAAVVSFVLLWRAIPWRPRLRFSKQRANVLLATALPYGATQSLQFAVQNFDTALVTYLLGPFGGGLYAAAKRITLAVQLALWQPISAAALPAFAEIGDDDVRLGRVSVKTAGVVTAITTPMFVAVAAAAPQLMLVLFGARWLAAAPILTILSSFGILFPSTGVLQMIVLAKRRARAVLYLTLLQTVLALTAIFLFAGRSAEMVALCLSAPALLTYALTLAFVGRLIAFPTARYLLAVGRPLAAGTLMAAAMLALPALQFGPLAQLAALLIVGGALYLGAMFLLARETLYEVMDFTTRLLPARLRRR
jgi:O-antigen/teichoic acid export membrane protein